VCSFSKLLIGLGGDGAVADVGVDLAAQRHADTHRLKRSGQVVDIGGNDQATACHLGTDQFGLDLLAAGHKLHGGRDFALAGQFQLGRHRADPLGKTPSSRPGAVSRAVALPAPA